MNKRFTIPAVAGAVVLLAGTILVAQQGEEPLDPRILAFDKGPAKIDVSKYPEDMKGRYKVFMNKCGKCHTPARAINSDYVLDDEWERYVKRMMRRAGTFISADEGKQIYEFVVFDSKIRKKAQFDKRSSEAAK